MVTITATEQNIEKRIKKKKKKKKKKKDSLRDLWDNIKCTNIHIIGVLEGEYRDKGFKSVFEEIIAENFPNMG